MAARLAGGMFVLFLHVGQNLFPGESTAESQQQLVKER